ncbi:MAG: type II toxin-antitoxin system Phd/YefM family antitoxin [Chloroflexi bacterium]|nr:type II toxin-antitoxin system Phd/YefM family antitoxin [Chloroflexota bacterium]
MSSREARAQWRELLDTIYRGAAGIVIERYGKPIAALVPYEAFAAYQSAEGVLKDETAVYHTKPPFPLPTTDENREMNLQKQIKSLPADAQKLVAEFVEMLQQQASNHSLTQSATVALPAAKLTTLTQLLTQGYEGNALADSEALYDDV